MVRHAVTGVDSTRGIEKHDFETDKAYLLFDVDKEIWIAKSLGDLARALKDHADAGMAGAQQAVNLKFHSAPSAKIDALLGRGA